MADFNKVILMGNITQDLKLGETNSGIEIMTVSIAVNKTYKGEKKTTYAKVTCFGNTAKIISDYFVKGDPILMECELENPEVYTKNNGDHGASNKLICNSFSFVKSGGQENSKSKNSNETPLPEDFSGIGGDDIPF